MSGGSSGLNKGEGEGDYYPPLEERFIFTTTNYGGAKQPALSSNWAPPLDKKWIPFSLPSPSELERGEKTIMTSWIKGMTTLWEDLRGLLALPHYIFWSSLVHCPQIRQTLLDSFLSSAPRVHNVDRWDQLRSNCTVWKIYSKIHGLYFRVFLRMTTYKESKEDHISPEFWSKLLKDNDLLNLEGLQSLSVIYYTPSTSGSTSLLQKMVGNVISHDPSLMKDFLAQIPRLREKMVEFENLSESLIANGGGEKELGHVLGKMLDGTYTFLRFTQAYPPAAGILLRYSIVPHQHLFLTSMAISYDVNTRVWGRIISLQPNLANSVAMIRSAILKLYRHILVTPTLNSVEAGNDKRLDDYFEIFANSIDEKIFIHDYEKNFPFRVDMGKILSRGIFVDETRIDYMANAISAAFEACGLEYSVEKIVVDPLYDPNFDRQLLGACSLEVGGVELESLVSTVKDLLPELPNSYIEAVLKHYGYKTENTINALLEGSVPSRLEKYKSEEYIRSRSETPLVTPTHKTRPVGSLPAQVKVKVKVSTDDINDPVELPGGEKFLPGKGAGNSSVLEDRLDDETKAQIHRLIQEGQEESRKYGEGYVPSEVEGSSGYVDSSLLPPTWASCDDYDDEYDDTYDDVGAGMTEPDNNNIGLSKINVLNLKKDELYDDDPDEEERSAQSQAPQQRSRTAFEEFCEDPAKVRERYERKREEERARKGHGGGGHNQSHQGQGQGQRDVVGRAKGQGQDKDVLYARRQKTANKGSGAGGNFKKRSDFKRKEF